MDVIKPGDVIEWEPQGFESNCGFLLRGKVQRSLRDGQGFEVIDDDDGILRWVRREHIRKVRGKMSSVGPYTSEDEIRAVLEEVGSELGCRELLDSTKIEWSHRFTSRIGDATWSSCGRHLIRLSEVLWPVSSPEERRETIVHEACHIFIFENHGGSLASCEPHGADWIEAMAACGYKNPSIYHHVDRTPVLKPSVKVFGKCHCTTHEITGAQARKVFSGQVVYDCSACNGEIIFNPEGSLRIGF